MAKRYTSLFVDDTADNKTPLPAVPTRPYRLLLVDDDPGVLAALRRVFQRENYQLLFAKSAEDALTQLESTPVELIVSDFMMPGMNGSELLRRVRERWPETLRIMLTGYANTEAVMGSMRDGAVYRFNLKPWDDDDLRLSVALALEQYELRRHKRILIQGSDHQTTDLTPLNNLDVGKRSQLAMLLHKKGLLNARQVQQLHKEMQAHKTPVMHHLLQHDWVDPARIYSLLRDERMCDEVDLRENRFDPTLLSLIPQAACERQWVLPLRIVGGRLDLAMTDPLDVGLVEAFGFMSGLCIRPLLCRVEEMQAKLVEAFGTRGHSLDDLRATAEDDDPYEDIEIILDENDGTESLEQLLGSSVDPPAVRLVNAIILEALRLGASDIHIHPRLKHVMVRYRIDGLLQDKIQIPAALLVAVVSRLKVMAELDISERRHPQVGYITVKTPMCIVDLRIATLPTTYGEQVAMQVSEHQTVARPLEELGLSSQNHQRLLHASRQPQGVILATGPADSGKITMLHALLQSEASAGKHYVTLEEPVAFHNDFAGQVPVKGHSGSCLASLLTAAVDQGPDVILLGTLQDAEVVLAAFQAALTGRQVLSALPAHSAGAAIARLLALGVTSYELASSLEAIVSQRLARRLCPHCREEVSPPAEHLEHLGENFLDPALRFYRGSGCRHCHQGYKGRIGLHEVLLVDDTLRDAIIDGASPWQLQRLAREQGMSSLLDDAHDKVRQGLTTVEEVLRLFGPQVLGKGS